MPRLRKLIQVDTAAPEQSMIMEDAEQFRARRQAAQGIRIFLGRGNTARQVQVQASQRAAVRAHLFQLCDEVFDRVVGRFARRFGDEMSEFRWWLWEGSGHDRILQ